MITLPEMKNSGIEWIGMIPLQWETCPLKRTFVITSGSTPQSTTDSFWDGNILWITPADFKTNDYYTFGGKRNISEAGYKSCSTHMIPPNSIIFSKRAPIGSVVINAVPLCTNQGCLACVPKKDINIKYYYFVMSVYENVFNLFGSGTTFKEISATVFGNLKFAEPPILEQDRIVEYLDSKCSEIDTLHADIEEQIRLLEEYKKSVITEVVTKGLDPNVEMKDSGVEWIGRIPVHWNCNKGKYIFTRLTRPVHQTDGVITCFRDGEVTLRSNRREEGFTLSDKEIGYQGINKGDLVVHGMDGFAGAIGISDSRGKGSPVLNVLDSDMNKKYLMYYLRSMAYNDVFLAIATGIRVRSCDLRWKKLAELPYPLPPISEQNQIAVYIDNSLNKANELILSKKQQLSLLEDYKKSLIYEYVTGKKEVPADFTGGES